jgi:hypothetical protein
MPKRLIDIRVGIPLLDIASYARRGPGHRDRLSPEEVQQIARTVRRAPEVVVKVLSRGGQDLVWARVPKQARDPQHIHPGADQARGVGVSQVTAASSCLLPLQKRDFTNLPVALKSGSRSRVRASQMPPTSR